MMAQAIQTRRPRRTRRGLPRSSALGARANLASLASRGRAGATTVLFVLALSTLMAACAMVIDLGLGAVGAQRCQNIADFAALAGATALPDVGEARKRAMDIVDANNEYGVGPKITVDPSEDIKIYGPNSTNTGLGGKYENFGPETTAIRVTCHRHVNFSFGRALDVPSAECVRYAVACCGPLSGTSISPIWMWFEDGVYRKGVDYNVYEGKEGQNLHSFGLAAYAGTGTAEIARYMKGVGLTPEEIRAATYQIGDILPVTNGNHGGAWQMGLYDVPDGRITRASRPPYESQTPSNFTPDNPRIIIVPLLDGYPDSGSAKIAGFGAFWIKSGRFVGNKTVFTGQFVRYTVPDAQLDPMGTGDVLTRKLIR